MTKIAGALEWAQGFGFLLAIVPFDQPAFERLTQEVAASGVPTIAGFFVKRRHSVGVLVHTTTPPEKTPKVHAARSLVLVASFREQRHRF